MLQMSVNNVSHTSPFHCSKMSLPPGTWPEELSVCQTPGCLSRTHLGLLGSHGYQSCSLKTLQRRNQFHKLPYLMLYLHMHKYIHTYNLYTYTVCNVIVVGSVHPNKHTATSCRPAQQWHWQKSHGKVTVV